MDSEGRFNLNDLHKASGGDPKDAPAQWKRHDSFHRLEQSLIHEANYAKSHIWPVQSKRGRYGGTFVVKELVYAYAMWISPAFNLKVIRAYDALVTQPQHRDLYQPHRQADRTGPPLPPYLASAA